MIIHAFLCLKATSQHKETPQKKHVDQPPPSPFADSEAACEFDAIDFESGSMVKGQLLAKAYLLLSEDGASPDGGHYWFVGKVVLVNKSTGVWIRYCGEPHDSKEV